MKFTILEYQQKEFLTWFQEEDIVKETMKAYLVDVTPEYSEKGLAWIPKSILKKTDQGIYQIPFWFAKKELMLRKSNPEVERYYDAALARLKRKGTEDEISNR